jgi:DNA-binding MarR family transcriptional regulator
MDENKEAISALEELFNENTRLFHRLAALLADLHHEGESSAGKRAILRDLARLGPQTVPQMARARPVTRQFIQKLVNELTEQGLVEFTENSAHKRSHLVQLTTKGRAQLEAMLRREAELLEGKQIPVSKAELVQANQTLRQLRQWLEHEHLLYTRQLEQEGK